MGLLALLLLVPLWLFRSSSGLWVAALARFLLLGAPVCFVLLSLASSRLGFGLRAPAFIFPVGGLFRGARLFFPSCVASFVSGSCWWSLFVCRASFLLVVPGPWVSRRVCFVPFAWVGSAHVFALLMLLFGGVCLSVPCGLFLVGSFCFYYFGGLLPCVLALSGSRPPLSSGVWVSCLWLLPLLAGFPGCRPFCGDRPSFRCVLCCGVFPGVAFLFTVGVPHFRRLGGFPPDPVFLFVVLERVVVRPASLGSSRSLLVGSFLCLASSLASAFFLCLGVWSGVPCLFSAWFLV